MKSINRSLFYSKKKLKSRFTLNRLILNSLYYLRAMSQSDTAIQTETIRFIWDKPMPLNYYHDRCTNLCTARALSTAIYSALASYDDDFVMGLYQDLVQLPHTRMHLLSLIQPQ